MLLSQHGSGLTGNSKDESLGKGSVATTWGGSCSSDTSGTAAFTADDVDVASF